MIHHLQKIGRISFQRYVQWVATLGVFLMTVENGIVIGWASPNLARFTSNSSDAPISLTLEEASWVASSMGFGGIPGSILGPVASEYFGAKRTILLSLVIISFEWASLTAMATNLAIEWLYLARALGGLAFSMSCSCFSIYLGEISSPETRGTLISVATSGTNLGVLVGTIAESYFPMRWTSLSYLVIAVLSVLLFLWLRDSPYYLVKTGNFEAARKAIDQYNGGVEVDKQFQEIKSYVETQNCGSLRENLAEFRKPEVRKSMALLLVLFALPHFSGVMALMSYMETILNDVRMDFVDSKQFVVWVQLVAIATSVLTVNLLDKFGRRAMLVISGLGCAVALGCMGLNFYLVDYAGLDPGDGQWLTVFGMLFYVVSYAVGYSIIPYTILGEIFPENVKSIAACIGSLSGSFFAFLCMKIYQPMIDLAGHVVPFWIFGLISVTSAPFALFVLPETKGKTLQQIQDDLRKK